MSFTVPPVDALPVSRTAYERLSSAAKRVTSILDNHDALQVSMAMVAGERG